MTTVSPTTTSAQMSMTTSTVMTSPHTITSATMAPNVQSLRDSVARLGLSPEIRRLMEYAEKIDHQYSGGGWELQQSQCRAEIGDGYQLTHHQQSHIVSPHGKTPVAETSQSHHTNDRVRPTPAPRSQSSRSSRNEDSVTQQRVPRNGEPVRKETERSVCSRGGRKSDHVRKLGNIREEGQRKGERETRLNRGKEYESSEGSSNSERVSGGDKISVSDRVCRECQRENKRVDRPKRGQWESRRSILDDSTSESESESDLSQCQRSGGKNKEIKSGRRSKVIKTLKDWDLKFFGDDDSAEEFLERLEDCKAWSEFSDQEILQALPIMLQKSDSSWLRCLRQEIRSWKSFKRAFKNEYLVTVDDDDVIDELRARTQGKGEKISPYLTCFRLILGHMKRPLDKKQQAKIAYKGLTPEYRRQLDHLYFDSLSQMEKILRNFEKAKDLDERYTPPPPKEKMRFPAAAVKESRFKKTVRSEAATSEEESESSGSDHSTKESKETNEARIKEKPDSVCVDAMTLMKTAQKSAEQSQVVSSPRPQIWPGPMQIAYPAMYAGIVSGGAKPVGLPNVEQNGSQTATKQLMGVCFQCQSIGHRARDCPRRICFQCQQQGHYAKQCPLRQAQVESCLVCKTPGVNFLRCQNCVEIRRILESGAWRT
ncbi:uncharacterized protein LOC122504523 [Leptopilina heterotoma]|uniref:uncharacterized protein LOC122504523 n=1 Tax=Leptopilina heterotoma TaxID=63436 RepID=UPI001CA94A2E|nr:uncharacterized protein LOC122504523 [Leptopilina heterotoma]